MRKARTSEEGDSDENSVDDDGGGDTEMDRGSWMDWVLISVVRTHHTPFHTIYLQGS